MNIQNFARVGFASVGLVRGGRDDTAACTSSAATVANMDATVTTALLLVP